MFIHESAYVENAKIGEGTKVWHFAHIRDGVKIGKNCIIGKDVYVDIDVEIGDNCKLENFATVYHGVKIGNDVFLGPHVCFTNDFYPRAHNTDWKVEKTIVEDGVSIGANSVIVCGITIGKNAMIGASSVVTKDVPPHALVYGNPAKIEGYVCYCGRKLFNIANRSQHEYPVKCTSCGKINEIEVCK